MAKYLPTPASGAAPSIRQATKLIGMPVPHFGLADKCSLNIPNSAPQVRALFMATVGLEELARASEELNSFESFVAPPRDAINDSGSKPSIHGDAGGPKRQTWWRGDGDGRCEMVPGSRQGNPADSEGEAQNQSWWDKDKSDRTDNRGYSKSNDDLKQAVKALGRLVLRQEDSLAVTQLDCQFIILMKNAPQQANPENLPDWTVTKQLFQVGSYWRDRKAKDPKSLGQPLRTVLFSSWLTALRYRINEMDSKPATKELAIQLGILEADGFPYLQWDPETSKHVKIQQDPLSVSDALQIVDQLQNVSIHPNVIGRFHPLRKLTESMTSDVIPWTLEIQNRTQEAQSAYALIGRLIRNWITHLASSTLRPSKLGRSPLATAVDKRIQEL